MSDSLLAGLAQQFGGDTIGRLANLVGGSQEETGNGGRVLGQILGR
jgi:hypothetical protein